MEELKMLLKNNIILREDKKEMYYKIKDGYKEFKNFITENLGYNLIIRSDFIRLEKLPGKSESFMGIEEFQNNIEYTMLMLILVFLEDKSKDDQFLLSHITESLSSNDIDIKFDWTDYSTRRSLIKVLKFSVKNSLIRVTDGDEDSFISDTNREVLFESSGVSKYIVRNFNDDILNAQTPSDLLSGKGVDFDTDKVVVRRNRVYRNLLLCPIVYRQSSPEDYEYIKNYKKYLEENFEKYLGWNLHVHKNGAMLVPSEKENGLKLFPNGKGISDVILFVLYEIIDEINKDKSRLNEEDILILNKVDFEQIVLKVKLEKSHGFSKEYREMSDGRFLYEIINEMILFLFIEEEKDVIKIFPLCGKIRGTYPEDYDGEVSCDEK